LIKVIFFSLQLAHEAQTNFTPKKLVFNCYSVKTFSRLFCLSCIYWTIF